MQRFLLILSFIVATALDATAGSGTATLTCRSASGRTVFKAKLQDIYGMFEGGTLIIDKDSVTFPPQDGNIEHHAIWDPKNGVFTLSYLKPGMKDFQFIRFWSIPSTFKVVNGDRSAGAVYEFEAYIEATEPRPDKGHATSTIRLLCTLTYRI
ncbi:MAG: hypothetical protein JNL52_11930 [Flavobacteriales bacterium]|nr:hypothetical protein [Flavobacteriales bacterium]